MGTTADFFISYTGKDKAWAEWIAWTLEAAGYKTVIQAWDFAEASNFVLKMQGAAVDSTRTIAVLTPDYFQSAFTQPEWAVAFASDPKSETGKLIPVRVVDFAPPGYFKTINYIDLVGVDEGAGRDKLLKAIESIVTGARLKPATKPAFPSTAQPLTCGTAPPFPGTAIQRALLHTLKAPVADFVERRELADLRTKLDGAGLIIAGVQGTGGVGKTEMARRLAVELKDRFPDAQIEIDLQGTNSDPRTPQQVMEQVIRAFHPQAGQLPERLDDLRTVYLQVLDGQHALLLLDNARDKAQVEPLLPPASWAVIVTSRQHFTLPKMQHAELGRLDPEDGRKLALEIAGGRADFPERLDDLLDVCDHLALAIRVAATAVAEKTTFTVAEHIERLRANRLKRLGPVAAALQASYDLLTEAEQSGWRLLAIFSADFEYEAAAAVLEVAEDEARDSLQALVSASLVEFNKGNQRFRLHDLARDFAREQLRAADASDRKSTRLNSSH